MSFARQTFSLTPHFLQRIEFSLFINDIGVHHRSLCHSLTRDSKQNDTQRLPLTLLLRDRPRAGLQAVFSALNCLWFERMCLWVVWSMGATRCSSPWYATANAWADVQVSILIGDFSSGFRISSFWGLAWVLLGGWGQGLNRAEKLNKNRRGMLWRTTELTCIIIGMARRHTATCAELGKHSDQTCSILQSRETERKGKFMPLSKTDSPQGRLLTWDLRLRTWCAHRCPCLRCPAFHP